MVRLKLTIVSTLDEDSPHTMTFLFIVLDVPCLKSTNSYGIIAISISFIYFFAS